MAICCNQRALDNLGYCYNDGIGCIVLDIPYQVRFLDLAGFSTQAGPCAKVANERLKTLKFAIDAPLTLTGTILTGVSKLLAECTNCTYVFKFGYYSFFITEIDHNTGALTAELVGKHAVVDITEIPEGGEICITGNADAVCSFSAKCSEYSDDKHDVYLQKITDCMTICEDEKTMIDNGYVQNMYDLPGQKARTAMNNHLQKIDATVLCGTPTKRKIGDKSVTTATSYHDYALRNGILDYTAHADAPMGDILDDIGINMKKSKAQAQMALMNCNTAHCFREKMKAECTTNYCPPQGTLGVDMGFTQAGFALQGQGIIDVRDDVDCLADGEILFVDRNNFEFVTMAKAGSPNGIFMEQSAPRQCDDEQYKVNIKTWIGTKVYDPTRTCLAKIACTPGAGLGVTKTAIPSAPIK